MFNRITIPIFIVAVIVYVLLQYTQATNNHVVDFVGGFLIGMLIAIIGTWISKLFFGKKKDTFHKEEKE